MFSVLVFIAGAIIADAGITHKPPGLRLHYPASSHLVRPVLIRSHIANPVRISPALSHAPVFPSTIFSPIVFSSINSYPATLPSFPNTVKLHPAPIRYVPTGPTSTITHISPPIAQSPAFVGPVRSRPVLNPAPVIEDGIIPAAVTHLPQPTVLRSAPVNHEAIKPIATTQETHYPINNNGISYEVQEIQEVPEKSISYSVSEKDYEYLKRHQTEGQDSPYNPIPGLDTSSPSETHQNTHIHHGEEEFQKPTVLENVLKRSAAPNKVYQRYAEPSFVNAPEPVVVKHIYFHVPQPEFEEPPSAPINLPPPKKTYNILFIKAPVQEQQNHAYMQQLLQSRPPQIEDKTLIYVLSKKQDPVVVLPPQQARPSSPEVYYVKYQTKPGDIADIKNQLVEESFIARSVLERKRSVKDIETDSEPENKNLDKVEVHSIT